MEKDSSSKLTHGEWLEALVEEGEIDSEDIPALKNKPELQDYLFLPWNMFWEISSSRQMGFSGSGYIIYSEVSCMLNEYQIYDVTERDLLRYLIQRMDICYLNYQYKDVNKKKIGKK